MINRKNPYKTYTRGGIKYDRVELSLKYLLIRRKLNKEIDAELNEFIEYMRSKGHHGFGRYCGSGLCHVRWAIKAKILKEKYNIEWHSPATLNPRVRFD